MTRLIENCRESIFTHNSHNSLKYSHLFSSQSVLGKTLLTLLPALAYGCTAEDNPSPAMPADKIISMKVLRGYSDCQVSTMDIFVFKDEAIQSLDCYQRVEHPEQWNGEIASSSGDRIISIYANSQLEQDEWPWIRSRDALKKVSISLELEKRLSPFMSGETTVSAAKGPPAYTDVILRPAVSEIHLRSLSCDFSGKPYAGEKLTDIKVYLTNINAECGMLSDGEILPTRLINVGRLCEEDLELFADPGLVFREITGTVGKTPVWPDIRLWCYPSNAAEESPGTPYSRLVIEGKISGSTYYWPININRGNDGDGISRNRKYIFDVRITRKGSTDPDIPVDADNMEITFNSEPWEEKEEYQVRF